MSITSQRNHQSVHSSASQKGYATPPQAIHNSLTLEKGGFITQLGDEAALVKVVNELLANLRLRHEVGEHGRTWVTQGFGWEDYVDRAVDVYRSIIA